MTEERVPTISVAMGTLYRQADTALLRRSVESILAQSYADFEFLICDDGSSPAARDYLSEAARGDGRIRLIRPGGCLTLPQKLNACLREARGRYVARMDDDDFSHPERFARQIEALDAQPAVAFVGANVRLCRGGETVGERRLPERPTARDFYWVQPYVHPTLMFRREALEAAGGYSEDRRCLLCEDYDLLLRLYAKGYQGMNLPCCLLDYSVPAGRDGKRTMGHRLNEAVTRYRRFKELKLLPGALPYVVKPLAVGLVPARLTQALKERTAGVRR